MQVIAEFVGACALIGLFTYGGIKAVEFLLAAPPVNKGKK